MTRPPILVLVMAGVFLLLVTSLLIGSFTKPELPSYPLTDPSAPAAEGIYTLDASRGEQWKRFHFARSAVVDSGPWDIAFRRNHVIAAPGVGVLDLGATPFDSVREVPADGYVSTSFGGDTVNAAIGKWYEYSMMSHLLTSRHHVYAVRTAGGELVVFEILAYYCRDVGAACYTIRYKATRPRAASSGARKRETAEVTWAAGS